MAASLETAAVHGPGPEKKPYDAVPTPVVLSATYAFSSTAELRDHFEGRIEREEYGRYGNPTVRAAEQKLSALERSDDTVLFPSGMSAITTLLLALLKPGDHVVMTSDCYRRTRQFLRTTLHKFGVEHTFVAPDDYPGIEEVGGFELCEKFLNHAKRYNLEIRENEVARVEPGVDFHEVVLTDGTPQAIAFGTPNEGMLLYTRGAASPYQLLAQPLGCE